MDDMCTDNRFELIERFKKKLIESTNIETSAEEMKAIDNLLFRFWQMGWLDIIDRMLLVKESAKTLMHSVGNSVSAKAFRNAGRFIQNAIDGEAPEFEKIPSAQPEWNNHTVACLLAELFDDPCACNYNGIDEWLPEKCEVIDSCPHPVGVACWEQYLKHRAERRTDETD